MNLAAYRLMPIYVILITVSVLLLAPLILTVLPRSNLPNTCLMRYPGRGNFIVMHIVPIDHERTFETYDFYFETSKPNDSEEEAIRYFDEVLQAENIALVESVQRGMNTPAFTQGRIVHDPGGSGKSEHAVHHFHGLVLDAYHQGIS